MSVFQGKSGQCQFSKVKDFVQHIYSQNENVISAYNEPTISVYDDPKFRFYKDENAQRGIPQNQILLSWAGTRAGREHVPLSRADRVHVPLSCRSVPILNPAVSPRHQRTKRVLISWAGTRAGRVHVPIS